MGYFPNKGRIPARGDVYTNCRMCFTISHCVPGTCVNKSQIRVLYLYVDTGLFLLIAYNFAEWNIFISSWTNAWKSPSLAWKYNCSWQSFKKYHRIKHLNIHVCFYFNFKTYFLSTKIKLCPLNTTLLIIYSEYTV